MSKDLTILKLGGSLLTDKQNPYSLREDVLNNVALEIKECLNEGLIEDLIILHGVGSFGHPPVLEYKLHRGFSGKEQLDPLSRTQQIVNQFRLKIVEALQQAGVPIILMHPSSIIVSEKMKMKKLFLEPLQGFMTLGIHPLLGGDLIFDTKMGFSVGSADQLAVILAKEFGAKRLMFATDVSGIYTRDPKTSTDAKIISEIKITEMEEFLESMLTTGADASGRMKGKLSALIPLENMIKTGLNVVITSMLEKKNLIKLLKNEEVEHTKIVA